MAGWTNGSSGSSLTQLNQQLGISISDDDVLYIGDSGNHRIVVVPLDSISNVSIIGSGPGNGTNAFNIVYDVFTRKKSLYAIDFLNHRVKNMSLDGSNPSLVRGINDLNRPYYLYVDINDNLYLSDSLCHRVLLLLSNATNFRVVAGTGVLGNTSTQLDQPYGIFVNKNGTIYIADCHNHRIMQWFPGTSAGNVIAGNGAVGTSLTQLSYPTQVILDTNGFMYVCEWGNPRITRWAPNSNSGECIVACTGVSGVASTELSGVHSLAFDRHGSLYVNDRENSRIQKFQIHQYQSKNLVWLL